MASFISMSQRRTSSGNIEPQEGWYLDTGASSHMTGCADSFSLLDHVVQGTVRFGNGSVVPIEGRGIVTFLGKTGEKIKIVDVLYIPRLKNRKGGVQCGFKQWYSESGIANTDSSSRFTGVRIACMYCRSMLPTVYVLESGMMKGKMSAGMLVSATLATTHCAS
jgi:hypothetical protein